MDEVKTKAAKATSSCYAFNSQPRPELKPRAPPSDSALRQHYSPEGLLPSNFYKSFSQSYYFSLLVTLSSVCTRLRIMRSVIVSKDGSLTLRRCPVSKAHLGRAAESSPRARRRGEPEESTHALLTCAGAPGPCRCACPQRHGATRQRRDHWHVHGRSTARQPQAPQPTRPMCSCSDLRSRCSYKKQSTESECGAVFL